MGPKREGTTGEWRRFTVHTLHHIFRVTNSKGIEMVSYVEQWEK
jgi:hypothetical protein